MKQQRPFKDKNALNSLKKLRKMGYTYPSLAFLFNVDHSSIYHHVRGLMPRQHIAIDVGEFVRSFSVDIGEVISLLGLHVHKNYKDYFNVDKYPNITRAMSKVE